MQISIIFTILNGTALIGWSYILFLLLSITFHDDVFDSLALAVVLPSQQHHFPIVVLLYILEGICLVEVGRIALGHLKGNLLLGLVLHAIRLACLAYILSDGLQLLLSLPGPILISSHYYEDTEQRRIILQTLFILYSWSITEVCRYPMYLFPSSDAARKLRLVVPLLSFPIGCALEAYGAYRAVQSGVLGGGGENRDENIAATSWMKIMLLWMVILINGLLGPTLAYPAILRKGLPVLMGTKKSVMRETPKKDN